MPDFSRSRLKQWILDGQVTLDGDVRAPRDKVTEGQTIELAVSVEPVGSDAPEAISLDVAWEDSDVIVINKPAGLVVHPGAGNPRHTLVNGLLYAYSELSTLPRAGIVHRLDKDTSGLLIVARSARAHTKLVRDLEERAIRREYLAVTAGVPVAGGTIDAPIGRHPSSRTRMAVQARGRPAVTHFRVLERYKGFSLLVIRLETGRTHQIRVHLAHERYPIVGDRDYSRPIVASGTSAAVSQAVSGIKRQALHARNVRFGHPVSGEVIDVRAALPADIRRLLSALRVDSGLNDTEEPGPWPTPASN